MNLIFALLVSRQYLTKEQIRESIADYRDSTPQAFDRKFERDKEELRELGITVEMGSIDKYFHDESGYRIRRDEAELPDLELTREEAAVIGLATQVWEHAGLANESTTALVKLKSIGVDVDTSVLRMAEPEALDRRAVVRRDVGRRHPAHPGRVRLRPTGPRTHGRGTSSRGGSSRGTTAGTSADSTSTATRPASSGCRASSATVATTGCARLVRGARGHRHEGPRPLALFPPAARGGRRAAHPQGPWSVAAPTRREGHPDRRRPRRGRDPLLVRLGARLRGRLRTDRTSSWSRRRPCATAVIQRLRPPCAGPWVTP